MSPVNSTLEAMQGLAEGRFERIYLIKPGDFAVLVRFDAKAQEFVLAKPLYLRRCGRKRRNKPISVAEILFQTQPHGLEPTTVA